MTALPASVISVLSYLGLVLIVALLTHDASDFARFVGCGLATLGAIIVFEAIYRPKAE